MSDLSTDITPVTIFNSIVDVAFKHRHKTDDVVVAIRTAKETGAAYKDLQQSFYIGELSAALNPKAPKATAHMIEEAARILSLKTYKLNGDELEYRTKEQQRLCTALRKAWQRIAAAAGIEAIDNRGGDTAPQAARQRKIMPLKSYVPPAATNADEVVEFTLDLKDFVQRYVEENSKLIPPDLRPVFATFIQGMAFAMAPMKKAA